LPETRGAAIDRLVLQRLHEALGLGVVVGVADPAHAEERGCRSYNRTVSAAVNPLVWNPTGVDKMALHGIWRTAILIMTNRLPRVTQRALKIH
jgi:hypothetical protein